MMICIRYLTIVLTVCVIYLLCRHKNLMNENGLKKKIIDKIINEQRIQIKREMVDYPYNNGTVTTNINDLSDLIMEVDGQPLRSVILSNWRSGSSFLGELLHAHPATFFYFEPLLYLGIIKIRAPPLSHEGLATLESLFTCNYTNLDRYLNYRKIDIWKTDQFNRYLKKYCHNNKDVCLDKDFSSKFCRLFPFQTTKIVGLRLDLIEKLLKNKSLGIKLIYLVRDPRGIMQSRKQLDWCKTNPDCSDSAILCSDMLSDYRAAVKFSKMYPKIFRVLRYEDISTNPYKYSKAIYDFNGLYFHKNIQNFINTHTIVSSEDPYDTYRNSKMIAFKWRKRLTFDEVNEIQINCYGAMKMWGYNFVHNHTHQLYINPLSNNTAGLRYL